MAGAGTTKYREAVLALMGTYPMHWRDFSTFDRAAGGQMRVLAVEVGGPD